MDIEEKEGEIHFLYTLSKGPVNKSYGIQVARLAGLPSSVIHKAKVFLQKYETIKEKNSSSEQMNLFSTTDSPMRKSKKDSVNSLTATALKPPSNQQKSQTTTIHSNEKNSFKQFLSKIEEEIYKYSLNESTPLDAMNQILKWQKELKKKLYS